ncbi:iron-containing redox enzyme family protein [Nocardioides sp. GXQ0305]|uniref:iron-containing redox enzyme family protein n=1 Tax=Nocardioides sp. GXQ0305 TaxID=3423912 RepID=UPI003D7C51CD
MRLPAPRGPLSRATFTALASPPPFTVDLALVRPAAAGDVLRSDDLQLTLWALYELHYRGFDEVADEHEWDPDVLRLRRELEHPFEAAVRRLAPSAVVTDQDFVGQLRLTIDTADGPPLAAFLHREADREQVLTFLRQRSLYHLKESDPHAFVVPRVDGRAKVALAELQYDEFGAGRPEALHSRLYADALAGAGLDPTYGRYVDETPAITLAVNNLMSLFGLHRRLRGAALGHLAAFETTSSLPCRKIAAGIERVGLPPVVAAYFEEHVEADAVHEQVALRDICGAFVETEPDLAGDVLLGASACLALDAAAAGDLLAVWADQEQEAAS